MIGRVVEIASDAVHLSRSHAFMVIAEDDDEKGRIAIDDISALIVRGYGATISINLCAALADKGVPVVLCGSTQRPDALLWPITGHFEQGKRMQAQADAKRPVKKRLWRDLVAAKIAAQAAVLDCLGMKDERLLYLSRTVKAGDPDNTEAQASRRYWPQLLGDDFRRDRSADGVNALLNYGYTVLRASAARSILAAGLHPSLSVHHESRGDALRLADDVMEPFRPFVDYVVAKRVQQYGDSLDQQAKASLAGVLTMDLEGPRGARPLQSCLEALTTSLALIYTGQRRGLELPGPPILFPAIL